MKRGFIKQGVAPDDLKRMAFMWARGWSASAIGAEFGLSKASVLGYAHRNRAMFPKRDTTGVKSIAGRSHRRKRKPPAMRAKRQRGDDGRLAPLSPDAALREPAGDMPDPKHVRFAETGPGQCRWPLEGEPGPAMTCCGLDIELGRDQPYCRWHQDINHGRGTASERVAHQSRGYR